MHKMENLLKSYLYDACPRSHHQRHFAVIFRGQDTTYAADLSTAVRQAVLLTYHHLRKSGRFFPAYVKENRTCRIVCRMEARDEVLQLAEAHFGLRLKKDDDLLKKVG
ncbi:MAG: hypothetical protein BAA01_12025 [Bacillus thermozeamaize]|uniref:Uncharacterized protein n=1 Tax=Bacillus thermozeamaize TaxID=230954 RepID=A0A1Y3PKJ3_9BACI|nr:MAG: hypothetical protein BAA01_12025 [Bacillus thermozeamaize]